MKHAPTLLRVESSDAADATPALAFDAVDLRARVDGWTPERQRAFVEALADTGIVRDAAARVGMSEQSLARLRRRPGSASFVAACEVATTIATRRIRSVAFDRAVNGYTKRHYYHGELKSEELVFDHRLLILLLEKTGLLADPLGRVARLEADWPETIAAITDAAAGTNERADDDAVWEEDGQLWTCFPPPAVFDGTEHGDFGDEDYRRPLTEAEITGLKARDERQACSEHERATRRRDLYFGFGAALFDG